MSTFPLKLTFKIGTLANDFIAQDANGITLAYVRQKMLRLVEEVQVFKDESRSELYYTIRANQWLDFSATYLFIDTTGKELGRVSRKGWASLWKAHFEIYNENQTLEMTIKEDNPWAKVFDTILGDIPFLNLLTGYFFHPSYSVTRQNGTLVARLKKEPSFFGRYFTINKHSDFFPGEESRVLLSLMMMILLERNRG